MPLWQTWEDGGSDRWVYARQMPPIPCGIWHIIRIDDMDGVCGRVCGRDNEEQPRYAAELVEVDLAIIPEESVEAALRSCGWDDTPDTEVALIECLSSYGCYSPLASSAGSNLRALERQMRRESRAAEDPERHAALMARPVNAIGQTAREYAMGDAGLVAPALHRSGDRIDLRIIRPEKRQDLGRQDR